MGKTNNSNSPSPAVGSRDRRSTTPEQFDPSWQQAEAAIDWQTPQLIMVVGIPGSGKSTWARLMAERQGCVVVAADDIREELFTDLAEANRLGAAAHQRVFAEAHARIRRALSAGQVVIADATNLYPQAREPLEQIAATQRVPLQTVFFDNQAEALRRNAARPSAKRVPDQAMQRMSKAARGLRRWLSGPIHTLR